MKRNLRKYFSIAGRSLPVVLSLLICGAPAAPSSKAEPSTVASRIKASYIYNFLQFVSFQPESLGEKKEVHVCLLGEDEFGSALDKIDGERIPQGVIKVSRLGRLKKSTSLGDCHALYLSASEADNVDKIMQRVDEHQVFTISEFNSFIEHGGLIELYEHDDSIRFRINENLVKETNFKVAAQLVQLGVN